MNRFVNRAILVLCVLAPLFSINCTATIGGPAISFPDFEGCFQAADSDGQPIILTLNSPDTAMGGASDALKGSLSFVFQDLRRCSLLEGQIKTPEQAKFKGTGEVPITVTRTEADGTVTTMTIKFSDESLLGPMERRGDPPEELCPAECPE